MDIEAHVVAQAMRLEQTGDAQADHLIQVAVDQADGRQAFQHLARDGQVDVPVGRPRLGQAERMFVAVADDLVDLALLRGELSGGRIGTRKVGCIVLIALGTGIDHHQLARLDHLVMQVVVQRLAMLGQDGREGNAPPLGQGNALHLTDDFLLDDTRNDAVAGDGMHLVTQGARVVDRGDFHGFLDQTHRHHRLDQRQGRLLGRASQLHQAQGVEIAARRQVMDLPSGRDGLGHVLVEFPVGFRGFHADALRLRGDRRLGAHPDDVTDFHIVCIDSLFPAFDIEDGPVHRVIQTEIIEPGTVLAPFITIVLVLGRRLGVADEQHDALFPAGCQLG